MENGAVGDEGHGFVIRDEITRCKHEAVYAAGDESLMMNVRL